MENKSIDYNNFFFYFLFIESSLYIYNRKQRTKYQFYF